MNRLKYIAPLVRTLWVQMLTGSVSTLALTVAVLLCSCGQSSMETAEMKSDKDSSAHSPGSEHELEAHFSSDSLSEEQKEMFSKRAIQKLEDLWDCLDIIADTTLDTALRNQAKALALEMLSEKISIDSIIVPTSNVVSISKTPQAVNDSLYQGELTSVYHITGQDRRNYMPFFVKKVTKNFGSEQRMVWEVYLSPH